jgi:hypothetical protein
MVRLPALIFKQAFKCFGKKQKSVDEIKEVRDGESGFWLRR